MTHPLVRAVRAALEDASDPAKAPLMQAYMKSGMPYRGVSAPVQKSLWRQLFPARALSSFDEWEGVALTLWREARFREERYAAIALTDWRLYARFRTRAAMPMFEEMIVTGAWWDYVDAIATHQVGDVLRADKAWTSRLMRRWARAPNLWKRRTALLCQIRFKRDTDLALLYDCIEPNLLSGGSDEQGPPHGSKTRRGESPKQDPPCSRDFFIRKAIGWALRQYAWVDPREVQRYVKANRSRLSPLSVKEALKNIG